MRSSLLHGLLPNRHFRLPRAIVSRALLACCFIATAVARAQAVPAFAEQTNQRCSACHVGGFGPQLTPFGRQFKLEGYTMRSGNRFTVPLAAMAVGSFVTTDRDQPEAPAPHYNTNDNLTLDEASIFLAGGIGGHAGGFMQFTYDGVGRAFSWDQLDLRVTTHEIIAGSPVLFGLTLNNNPTVQDPWNTLSAWGFPFTESDLAPSPAAAPVISDALAQRVVGASAYAWWNSQLYAEAGVYWRPGRHFLSALGTDISDGDAVLKGGAPYLRAAYQRDFGLQTFEVGAFGFFPRLYPGGDKSLGTDTFIDLGLDASWETTLGSDAIQIDARYVHERQNRKSSFAIGAAANAHDTLNEMRLNASYYWRRLIGATIGPFEISGSKDSLLYGDNRTFSPDSAGVLFQLDYTPWGTDVSPLGPRFNIRVGVQYTLYFRFDGAGKNFDGLGHDASDNNTLRLFTWIAF